MMGYGRWEIGYGIWKIGYRGSDIGDGRWDMGLVWEGNNERHEKTRRGAVRQDWDKGGAPGEQAALRSYW